jgi:Bacterial Ig-like domain (group 3)/FG-GAP-like repeat
MWNVAFSACRRTVSSRRFLQRSLLPALLTIACSWASAAQAAPLPATTTTLTVSSPSVAWHTPVTLTASVTVTASGTPVPTGSVTFCDASAHFCEDTAILGKAQLVGGNATLRLIPAIGSHTYKAVFNGPTTAAASTSSSQTLTVTGLYPTTTAIAATGNASGYDLTATIVGFASQPPVLAGSVTFQDTTNNNTLLGTVALGTPVFAQTFNQAPGSPVQTGNAPSIAGVGDFNEDGIPDLAIENAGDNTISILLGKGDGTFAAATPVPQIGTPPCENISFQSNCAIVVGDFNNDGHADLALTSDQNNAVVVLKGNGQGGFTPFPGSPIAVGNFPQALKIGDFNNDGIQDLAVANANDNTVSILLGNGDGTFTAANGSPISAGIGIFPFFLAVADFNNDGNADLAVVNGYQTGDGISVLEGNGDGTFTPFAGSPIPLPNGAGPGAIVAADFNGDGNADIAVANFLDPTINNGSVDIFLGNGKGAFTASAQSPINVGPSPFAMTALDYNGNGITDLAVANYAPAGYNDNPATPPPPGTVTLLIGKGDGTFSTPLAPFPVGQLPNDVVTADFNGDGKPDLATPDSYGVDTTILLNTVTQTATATLDNVVLIGAGTHVVEASYPANTAFAASSATIDLQGVSIPTSLTLSANPTQQMITMPVTFTAQLTPASSIAATGTVTFYDQSVGAQLGTAPVSASGQAVLTLSSIGPGVHSITASYGGDPLFPASNSNAVSVTIDELRILRVGNNNTTILPGTTVAYTLQVQPQVATTFLYNVSFAASGLPAGATATFSPATLQAGGSMTNITMKVMTAGTALNTPPSPFERLPLALGFLLPLFGSRVVRRRLRQIRPSLGVALFAALSLAAVAGLSGCSGAGLFAARKVPYTITVTATEGTVQRTVEVPLAIQ